MKRNQHGQILSQAMAGLLGKPQPGAMAFVRCLMPEVVRELAVDPRFLPSGWDVHRVTDENDAQTKAITADKAVEMREKKEAAVLLLVDTERAGAGMDGIYSAAREVNEAELFDRAKRLALREVRKQLSPDSCQFAEQAVKKARGYRNSNSLSRWAEFDYLCQVATGDQLPGAHLHILGLWNILGSEEMDSLNTSRMFVNQLLGATTSNLPPSERIKIIRLSQDSKERINELERFLNSVRTKTLCSALEELANQKNLWIGNLQTEFSELICDIKLSPWRQPKGSVYKWSGLEDTEDGTLEFLLKRGSSDRKRGSGDRPRVLEVRWKAEPPNLEKDAVRYRVTVKTDLDEDLADLEISHSAKGEEKARFTSDDFDFSDEDTLQPAKVTVEIIDNAEIQTIESEEFRIRFGDTPERKASSGGVKMRTLSEGLAECGNREIIADSTIHYAKDFVHLKTPVEQRSRKGFKVFRPSLITAVEKQWVEKKGEIGRWKVQVRSCGNPAAKPEFHPYKIGESETWEQAVKTSRKLAERFGEVGGVGQVYDEKSSDFRNVQEYLRQWALLLEGCEDPLLSLANTVEVQSLSGNTIGLIVLPAHPLRVAWHVAYDNLVFHAAFEQNQKAKDIRDELGGLDGAMFPAFLPNPKRGVFVFADTLGFHSVAMVPDSDTEPKAAVAILARTLGGDGDHNVPTASGQSAKVLTDEIWKYLKCHDTSHLLHIHALRAGDGQTVARSLGGIHERYQQDADSMNLDSDEKDDEQAPAFSLSLYPSKEQEAISGRFITEVREKRRNRAGSLAKEDSWMLKSLNLPGNINVPCLRWARRETEIPDTAAHVAIAFDTFESLITLDVEKEPQDFTRPYYVFGLLSFYERHYTRQPLPTWINTAPVASKGEKHPSRRGNTDLLERIQKAIQHTIVQHINEDKSKTLGLPALRTEISSNKEAKLEKLHRLCDWVLTLDRNAGIEYFDSSNSYVIDCVPEREDLGCLRLITSTARLDEIHKLLNNALDQMGLIHSSENANFLLEHLKALSGHLAIRLTGHQPVMSELIALAVSHANCVEPGNKDCWFPLEKGFFIPVDDVKDLLPPLLEGKNKTERQMHHGLIYVTVESPKNKRSHSSLSFRFMEVKYRRHLRSARSHDTLKPIKDHIQALRGRWDQWYTGEDVCSVFRAIRRAKLARVLHFYADRAYRHHLKEDGYRKLISEIDRMIESGSEYSFSTNEKSDRGWVFCSEYRGSQPLEILSDRNCRIFLFGSTLLQDLCSDFISPSSIQENQQITATVSLPKSDQKYHSRQEEHHQSKTQFKTEKMSSNGDKLVDGSNSMLSVCLGTNIDTNSDVNWQLGIDGNPHLLIAGTSGMGKTTCLVNLCKQMVAADVWPIVFSYHQDIDEKLENSLGGVRFIDFDGLGFNPLQVINRNSRRAYLDVAGAMRDIFAAIYPDLGDVQLNDIRIAIKESFEEMGWRSGDANAPEPAFRRFIEILQEKPNPDRGLRTLLGRLEELDDYGFFDTDNKLWGSLWEDKRPSIIRIHKTQNENLQRAFTYLIFYNLYKNMFLRGIQDRITHALILDEAHRASRLRLIPTMAKECRKYGISLVLASQGAKDFDESVFSAVASYLILHLTDADAKVLVKNVSNSKQEKMLIDKIKQMNKYKALYFGEGKSKPSYLRLLSPE